MSVGQSAAAAAQPGKATASSHPHGSKAAREAAWIKLDEQIESMGWEGPVDGLEEGEQAPMALLPHNVVVSCPPLSLQRPFPNLLAQPLNRRASEADSPSASRPSSSRGRTYSLPLPSTMAAPYTFGPATFLSASDPRPRAPPVGDVGGLAAGGGGTGLESSFLAFFPRLGAVETRRCLEAVMLGAATGAGQGGEALPPDLASGMAGQLLGGASTWPAAQHRSQDPPGSPLPFASALDPLAAPHGGSLVLYTRPNASRAVSAGQPVFSHTYEVHSWYDVPPNGEPRAVVWLFPPRKWVVEDASRATGAGQGGADQERDHDMDGGGNGHRQRFFPARLPALGPRPPTSGDTAGPSFLVLHADERISLFSPPRQAASFIASSAVGAQDGARQALNVLSASVATSSIVRSDAIGESSAEKSAESAARNKRRRISRTVALSLRAEDESVWLAYQAERCTSARGASPDGSNGLDGAQPAALDAGTGMLVDPTQIQAPGPATSGLAMEMSWTREKGIDLAEIRLDLLSPVTTLQTIAHPCIHYSEPAPDATSSSPEADRARLTLQSLAFCEVPDHSEKSMEEPTRPLDLLVIQRKRHRGRVSTLITRHALRETRLNLSGAFASLLPGPAGRRAMQEAESRFEWVSRTTEQLEVPRSLRCLDASDAASRNRLLVMQPAAARYGYSWLDCGTLSLTTAESQRKAAQTIGHASQVLLRYDGEPRLRWRRPPGIAEEHDRQTILAWHGVCVAAGILDGENAHDVVNRIESALRVEEIDVLLDHVWAHLAGEDAADTPLEQSDWLVPMMKLQHALYSLHDPRRCLHASSVLQLIATLDCFESCATRLRAPVAKDALLSFIPRYYDVDSVWTLLAHMEWYLQFLRSALKRAVLQGTSGHAAEDSSVSAGVFILIHPFTRRLLLSLNSHIVSFHRFVSSIRRPLASAPGVNIASQRITFQLMGMNGLDTSATALRDVAVSTLLKQVVSSKLAECGIAFDKLNAMLDGGAVVANGHSDGSHGDEPQSSGDHDTATDAALLHFRLTVTAGIATQIQKLASPSIVTASQLSLFYDVDPLTGDMAVISDPPRDLISQEPLEQALQRGSARQCNLCQGLTAAQIGGAEGAVKRWMERWSQECWCGGTWRIP